MPGNTKKHRRGNGEGSVYQTVSQIGSFCMERPGKK